MKKFKTALTLSWLEMIRNKTSLLLILVLPGLFELLIYLTTPNHLVSFELGALKAGDYINVSARSEAFVFMAVVAVAFITGFTGLALAQRSRDTQKRLVLCGLPVYQLFLSRAVVLLILDGLVSIYTAGIVEVNVRSPRFAGITLGLALTGAIYGAYGMFIGVLWKRNIESVLSVVLLTNIDVGWLQNPIFYTEATNKAIIHRLPGYFPTQVAMVAAFTTGPLFKPLIGAVLYAVSIFAIAWMLTRFKIRVFV